MTQNTQPNLTANEKRSGCGTIFAFVAISLWVVFLAGIDIFLNWTMEQSLFESSTTLPDFRWVTHGITSSLILITLLITYFVAKNPRLKIAAQVWAFAAGFALLATPVKKMWITYQQETTVLLILLMFIYTSVIFLIRSRKMQTQVDDPKKKRSSIFGLIALVAGGLMLPWILWGALGSLDDTLLYLVMGLEFGFMTVLFLFPFLFDRTQSEERELHPVDFLIDGFVAALFLILLLTSLAQNGSQPLLIIVLPVTGWVMALIAIATRGTKDHGRLSVGLIAAFALIGPLLWFDADELALVISSGAGETLTWATKAAWFSFSVSMLVMILLAVNFKMIGKLRLPKKVNLLLPLLVLTGLSAVYFTFGQPGFYGEKVFVVMNDQADLSIIDPSLSIDDKRAEVYSTLVQEAETSQKDIRAQLNAWHISYTPYYLVNGLEVKANAYYRMQLRNRSDVARILESPQLRPLPEPAQLDNSDPVEAPSEPSWNLSMIGVDKVRSELGITGKGVLIGQADSGVDGRHVELASSYRGVDGTDDYNWLDPWNSTPFPVDAGGHGTATLALITGKNIGIAPDAQWIGCVNLARNLGNPAVYLNCMQFLLAPYPQDGDSLKDGDPAKGAMIINNSWGCPVAEGCDSATYESAAAALEKAGIFLSVAAGNNGYYGCSTVSDPLAIYSEVFTAGSINEQGELSAFSSLGPVIVDGSGRVKPNLLAPGEQVVSAFPNNTYTRADGTSFSAPHVSGVVALMWSANPNLIGNVELTQQILEETAKPYTGTMPDCVTDTSTPNDAAGYGILDAYAAVKAALDVK